MGILIIIIAVIIVGIIILIFSSEESWINKAQKKQDKRFDYMNDHITAKDDPNKEWDPIKNRWIDKKEEARKERYREFHKDKPAGYEEWRAQVKEEIRIKHKIVKNQTFDEWIREHKQDGYQGNLKEGVKWYPTGWTYNEKTKVWDPPNYLRNNKETEEQKQARMERYRKFHEGQPPTFEEWKAQREKEKQEQQK